MQGLGNDFVVIDTLDLASTAAGQNLLAEWNNQYSAFAKSICDRRFGVGGDGLILMTDFRKQPELRRLANYQGTTESHVGWIYINGDGSKAEMCGNGLRCAALYARNHFGVDHSRFTIATSRGNSEIIYKNADEITINLGEPILEAEHIPLKISGDQVVRVPLGLADLQGTAVSMGNPHIVIFDADPSTAFHGASGSDDPAARFPENFAALAPQIQSLDIFSQGVNVEFSVIESDNRVRVYVWERGCGATLACATGAAAVVVAGVLEKKLLRKTTVQLLGGALEVEWSEKDNCVRLSGPARESFSGNFELSNLFGKFTARDQTEAICS